MRCGSSCASRCAASRPARPSSSTTAPASSARPRSRPRSRSTATGIGSWPGTDVAEALAVVRGELPDLPYLPELPARGPGADMIGRAAARLVSMPIDLQPGGWRLVDRPGRDQAGRDAFWREDLDRMAHAFDGYTGPLKVQLAGPWTLAVDGLAAPRRAGRRRPRRHPRPGRVDGADGARAGRGRRPAGAGCARPSCSWTSRRCRRCSRAGCRRRPASAGCGRSPRPRRSRA